MDGKESETQDKGWDVGFWGSMGLLSILCPTIDFPTLPILFFLVRHKMEKPSIHHVFVCERRREKACVREER